MNPQEPTAVLDGIHALLPTDRMIPAARHLRDTYARTPGTPLVKREFGYYCLDRWKEQGMPAGRAAGRAVRLRPARPSRPGPARLVRGRASCPVFETKVLEDRGDHELVQDFAGRHVLYFKGRRNGFMPEYVDHPVKDLRTWEENVKWRLDPTRRAASPTCRAAHGRGAQAAAAEGLMIVAEPHRRLHVPAQPDRPGGPALRVLRRAGADPRLHADVARRWPTRSSPATSST